MGVNARTAGRIHAGHNHRVLGDAKLAEPLVEQCVCAVAWPAWAQELVPDSLGSVGLSGVEDPLPSELSGGTPSLSPNLKLI